MAHSCAQGIKTWIQGGISPEDWALQLELQKSWPGVVPVFGVHPVWVAEHSEHEVEEALVLLPQWLPRAKALGEIGLDHGPKVDPASYARQLAAFQNQIELAPQFPDHPWVMHIVQAHGPALEILEKGSNYKGIIHSFSGAPEIAERYLKLGFSLSVSAVVTRAGYKGLKAAISMIPGERLLVETDCPDQKPKDFAKEWNEPSALFEAAEAVSALRNEPSMVILERSAQNARRLFGI